MEIPPKYFWPGLVSVLLIGSVGANATAIWMSQSDGGVQVVDNARSTEGRASEGEDGERARWTVRAERDGEQIVVVVDGPQGRPVTGLTGSLLDAGSAHEARLRAVPERRGVYAATTELADWEFPVRVRLAGHDRQLERPLELEASR